MSFFRMMVLEDGETCADVKGSQVIEFASSEDADAFADDTSDFNFIEMGEVVEVPVVRAIRKEEAH